MILYYALGTCSLADHIALYEAGMCFGLVKVDIKTHKMEDGRSFLDVNPKGYVPALKFDDGEVLTENVAILSYIADQCPALDVPGKLGRYRRLEMLAYLAAELHKAFHPLFDPKASAAEKKAAGENVEKKLAFVATKLKGPYLFGENPTVADPYLFVMLRWAAKNKLAIPEKLKAYSALMQSRPEVQMALKHEELA
jgi:glutathione S-transferase